MLWEMATQLIAFEDITTLADLRKRICIVNERPPLDKVPTVGIQNLLKLCWHKEPSSRPSFNEIIDYIDENIIIECVIKDPTASEFWRNNFGTEESVLIEDFWSPFLAFVGVESVSALQNEYFSMLVVTQKKDGIMKDTNVVTLLDFGRFLDCFGPVLDSRQVGNSLEDFNILQRMEEICRCDWFHGAIDKPSVETKLAGCKPGKFLVRMSTTVAGFAISFVNSNKWIHHHRIEYNGKGQFHTIRKDLSEIHHRGSLPGLIEMLKSELALETAITDSPFSLCLQNASMPALYSEGYSDTNDGLYMEEDY